MNDTLESFSNIADDVSAAAVHGHDGLHDSVAELGHDGVQQQAAVRVGRAGVTPSPPTTASK